MCATDCGAGGHEEGCRHRCGRACTEGGTQEASRGRAELHRKSDCCVPGWLHSRQGCIRRAGRTDEDGDGRAAAADGAHQQPVVKDRRQLRQRKDQRMYKPQFR